MHRLLVPILAGLIVVAAVLRLAGVFDDFWLDEIWSWRIVLRLQRPWQALTHPEAMSDNNHPLNTMLMWFVGGHMYWRMYRLPALVAGIGAVILAAIILRRRGPIEAVLGVLLVGFSYPLIHYSSEARGYALAVFLALVAFDALERFLSSRRWMWNLIFVAACVLGVTAHLTFVYFFAAALVCSTVRVARTGGARSAMVDCLRLHLLPAAWIVALYFIFVRRLTIGGAPTETLLDALRNALGRLLGAGESAALAVVLILVAAMLLVIMLGWFARKENDLWILLLVIVAAPVIVLALQQLTVERPQPPAARYFLVPFVFFLLGLAIVLADWLHRARPLQAVVAVLVVGFVLLNLYQTAWFLRIGRGHYRDAVAQMAMLTYAGSPVPVIVVSSDHHWRTGMVLDYYARLLPPQQQMVIYDDSNPPHFAARTHGPPMFVIVHSHERGRPPIDAFDEYVFDREYSYYGLSGYSWYMYRHRSIPPAR